MKDREPRELRNQKVELPGNSVGLTPETLSQRLRDIQKRITFEAIASPLLVVASLPMLYLAMFLPGPGADTKTLALVAAWNLGFAALGVVGLFTGLSLGEGVHNDLAERDRIIKTATENEFNVRGLVFKRIG